MQSSADYKPLLWLLLAYLLFLLNGPFLLNSALSVRPNDWLSYLIVDYGKRLIVLALLMMPALRGIAFRREPLLVPQMQAWILILGCILMDRLFVEGLLQFLSRSSLGFSRPFHAPHLPPGIHEIDMFIGMFLVALSEELVCRRCTKYVLQRYFQSDGLVIVVSALMFGVLHWTYGLPHMIYITLTGGIMMAIYLQVGALWPLVVAHYIIDVIAFW